MTDPMTAARRRAEAAFSLLTHSTTPLQRAVDDAQADVQARAQKTQRLRNARLERERHTTEAKSAKDTKAGIKI